MDRETLKHRIHEVIQALRAGEIDLDTASKMIVEGRFYRHQESYFDIELRRGF